MPNATTVGISFAGLGKRTRLGNKHERNHHLLRRPKWQNTRVDRLKGAFSGSPLVSGGVITSRTRSGQTYVVEPNRERLKVVSENSFLPVKEVFGPPCPDSGMIFTSLNLRSTAFPKSNSSQRLETILPPSFSNHSHSKPQTETQKHGHRLSLSLAENSLEIPAKSQPAARRNALPVVHGKDDDTTKIALVGCGGRGTGAAGNAWFLSWADQDVAMAGACKASSTGASRIESKAQGQGGRPQRRTLALTVTAKRWTPSTRVTS